LELAVRVYCVTTAANAQRIALDGFQDTNHGTRCRGILVHVKPVCVTAPGLAVIHILVGDRELDPYINGDVACVPAHLLNAGCAEILDG
jgi:hypothetical protein